MKLVKSLLVFIFSFCSFFIFIEFGVRGIAMVHPRTHNIIQSFQSQQESSSMNLMRTGTIDGGEKICSWEDYYQPHSIFNYVHNSQSDCTEDVNSNGFIGPDVNQSNSEDVFIVALSGGSVAAQQFQKGQFLLEKSLNERYRPPSGKKFKVVGAMMPGWVWPEQKKAYSFFKNKIDAFVTLDGFNEVYQFEKHGRLLPFPLAVFAAPPKELKLKINWIFGFLKFQRRLMQKVSVFKKSYLLSILGHAQLTWANQLAKNTLLKASEPQSKKLSWQVSEYMNWIRSDAQFSDIKTAFFIQPIPQIAKPLTRRESWALRYMSANFKSSYSKYAKELLNQSELPIFNLSHVFQSSREEIYSDMIHTKKDSDGKNKGAQMIADAMAQELAVHWGLKRK